MHSWHAKSKVMQLLDLPDELRHVIIRYVFEFAKVGQGETWIEWHVGRYNMCCDAQDLLW